MDEITLNFDPQDLTASELYYVGEYVGSSDPADWDNVRALVAIAFVFRKRQEPATTIEDMENTSLRDLLAGMSAPKDTIS